MGILRAVDISKSFAGVRVLDGVTLEVSAGTVHALTGENGAGKSTLMNILMGLFPPDKGTICLHDEEVHFSGTRDALSHGLSMIHQELQVFPDLTVAENIMIGREPLTKAGWIDRSALYRQAEAFVGQLGLTLPLNRKMKELSVGAMQLAEIVRAVSNDASVLIMDEPTSAISTRETEALFRIIASLREQGKAIIYISHKMDEIFAIADKVTVLRDGRHIATRPMAGLKMDELIPMIVGRELSALYEKQPAVIGDRLLEVRDLHAGDARGVSFDLRKGEILGVAGLMGAGRTAVAHALAGMEKITAGKVRLRGDQVNIGSPRAAKELGIGLVTEDRKQLGLILDASVRENIVLPSLERHGRGPLLDGRREKAVADREINRFRIKTASREQSVGRLSGGNQQKVVISAMSLNDPELVIFDEPTRGVDIGAKQEIYRYISQLAASGKAVILISSELPEILALSDRILVMRDGKVKAILEREGSSQEQIMKYAMA